MRILRRLLLIALIVTIALPIAAVSSVVVWNRIAPKYYAYKWSEEFNKIKTIHDAEMCSQSDRDIFVYKFDNHEWLIARCETSCCSGAGYNISIIHDSQGNTYMNTEYSFCGREIGEILERFATQNLRLPKSLDDFYKNTPIPLTKRSGPGA